MSLKKNQECDGNNLVMKIRKLFINSIWITEKAVEIYNINIQRSLYGLVDTGDSNMTIRYKMVIKNEWYKIR